MRINSSANFDTRPDGQGTLSLPTKLETFPVHQSLCETKQPLKTKALQLLTLFQVS